jgi:DNA-binding XRE family transcriptional regulator
MTIDQLRDIRWSLDWSQATMAERIGVSLRQYKYIERGCRSTGEITDEIPRHVVIAVLAAQLANDPNVTPSEAAAITEQIRVATQPEPKSLRDAA